MTDRLTRSCFCCNRPAAAPKKHRDFPTCPDCAYAGCTPELALPTDDDPHLMETAGLNRTQKEARRQWHLQALRTIERRLDTGEVDPELAEYLASHQETTEAFARMHRQHHQRQIDRFAYRPNPTNDDDSYAILRMNRNHR